MFIGGILLFAMIVVSLMFGSSMGWGKVALIWAVMIGLGVVNGVFQAFGWSMMSGIVSFVQFIVVLGFFAFAKASTS